MSEYYATIRWQRGDQEFLGNKYSRVHQWEFDGGYTMPASPSPHIVPPPMSAEEYVDPEEAFVASLSSCHMLFFLSIAAKNGLVVDDYIDHAVGVMGKNPDGRMAMVRVTLNPQVSYVDDEQLSLAEEERLHHKAHALCFIANSVKTEIKTVIKKL